MLLELFERKEKRASGHCSLLALSMWVVCNNYGAVSPHAGGVPGALIGRAQGTKVNIHWRGPSSQSPICWGPQDVSSPADPE